MRRLPALVPWSATSRSRAAPCCSGSSSQSSSLWPSWRAVEGDVAGAPGGWAVAGAVVAGVGVGAEVGAEVVAASAGSVGGVVFQAAAREGASSPHPFDPVSRWGRGSAGAFPIDDEDRREPHRLLAGRDAWSGIQVDRGQLRRQLEHELMGKLVRLRQAYAALHEDPKQLARVVVGSAGGFFTMLRAVLRLAGRPVPASPAELVRSAAALAGFTADALAPLVQHAMGGPVPRLA